MKKSIVMLFTAFFCLWPAVALAESILKNRYSDAELIEIMKNDGYSAITKMGDGALSIRVDGVAYILLNNSDGDLQTYYGTSGTSLSYEEINQWNRTMRLSRAYLDSDKDPVLEADLMANGGLSQKNITEFFRVFVGSVKQFREFIIKHNDK